MMKIECGLKFCLSVADFKKRWSPVYSFICSQFSKVNLMNKVNLVCKSCGSTTFTKGEINSGYANVMPIGKYFSFFSPLIFIFCKRCGEVASIKVEKLEKF